MEMNKQVIVLDVYENTYRRGVVVEDGLFLTIEMSKSGDIRRRYQYPKRDIEAGEFVVFVKEI